MEITNGVNLHLKQSQKFKTIQMSVYFRAPLDVETMTARELLAQLVETNTKDYPSQTALNEALSNLYGLSFRTSTTTFGEEHVVVLSFNLPDPNYLTVGDDYLQKVFDFIESVTFRPNIEDGKFDEKTFEREKIDLKEYIESQKDDKSIQALESLLEMTFEDPARQVLSGVRLDDLEKLDAKKLAETYESMFSKDSVEIIVYGDVDAEIFENFASKLAFIPRKTTTPQVFHDEADEQEPLHKLEKQDNAQTNITQAYKTPIRIDESNYYAGLVFNSLFGGDIHSKLFQNVREKASLAYRISSMLVVDSGMMLVLGGIESQKIDQAQAIIAEQLVAIADGDISGEELNQSKVILINNQKAQADDIHRLIQKSYQNLLFDRRPKTLDEAVAAIEAVTKEDVVEIAKAVSLQTEFILQGK